MHHLLDLNEKNAQDKRYIRYVFWIVREFSALGICEFVYIWKTIEITLTLYLYPSTQISLKKTDIWANLTEV